MVDIGMEAIPIFHLVQYFYMDFLLSSAKFIKFILGDRFMTVETVEFNFGGSDRLKIRGCKI